MANKKKPPFEGKYVKGSQVWCLISRSKGAWRVGEVDSISADKWQSSLEVRSPGMKQTRTVHDGWHASELMTRAVVPHVPAGTIYLVDTNVGSVLSQRIPGDRNFSVYECGTRAMTAGNLLGYVILPGYMYNVKDWHDKPGYQTWTVGPSVFELLSFLGNKLPEILEVNQMLSDQEKKENEKADSELDTFEAN